MTEEPKTAPPNRVLTSEASGAQRPEGKNENLYGASWGGYTGLPGATESNPLAFPGWNGLYTGTYATYRWMLQHPIIQLANSIALGPIAASSWEYEAVNKSVPKSYVTIVREQLDPLRLSIMDNFFVHGRNFGWAGGENVWEQWKGKTWLKKIKPLVHDKTEVLVSDHGNPVGLRNYSVPKNQKGGKGYVDLPMPFKAFHWAYDSYAGYVYGRSWLENIRTTAWVDWLSCAQQLEKLGVRLTGIVSIITSPAGTFPGPNGTQVSYKDNAIAAIKALAEGASGIWFPSISLAVDEKGQVDSMKLLAELAGKSLTNIQTLDFGSHSTAIKGLLERMIHDEELMFAGSLRPARSGLSGGKGTGARAESETHTDTGITNAELDDSRFAQACQRLVDGILFLNKGPDAVGTVRINPPPLVNRLAATIKAFVLALMNNPVVSEEIADAMGDEAIFKVLGIPMKRPLNVVSAQEKAAKRVAAAKPKPAAPKTPEPQGGKPPTEGA